MYSFGLYSRVASLQRRSNFNDAKVVFCSTAEAEGLLVANIYPFSYGSGSVSADPFGLPIFFAHRIIGYSLVAESTDEAPHVEFELQHLAEGELIPVAIDTFQTGGVKHFNKKLNSATYQAGQICLKVVSCSGLSDQFGKYRTALYLQSDEMF